MAEAAAPWHSNQQYAVKVCPKAVRALTYDVLPPAPSSDTTTAVQEAGGALGNTQTGVLGTLRRLPHA